MNMLLRIAFMACAMALTAMSGLAQAADRKGDDTAVSVAVGEPLQAAQELLQARQYKAALAKVAEAEKAGSISPYERYMIDRMRGSAAVGAGDTAAAIRSFEAVLDSSFLPAADRTAMLEALARLNFSARHFPATIEAVQKYKAAGGSNPTTLEILPQAYYLGQRYAEAARELERLMAASDAAGKAPSEQQIQLLASCALKQGDMDAYVSALRRMVTYYPSEKHWLDLVLRTANRSGFSDRLSLDVYRLRQHTGTLDSASDYMEAVQLALQSGFPGEADQLIKQGFKSGLLGKGQAQDVNRQKRLQELVQRKISEDKATLAEGEAQAERQSTGDALVNTGQNYVAYGQYDKGIALIRKGIAKGGLKRPEDARLHLGYAQYLAGQKDEASRTFATVKGADGSRDLAALWILLCRRSA